MIREHIIAALTIPPAVFIILTVVRIFRDAMHMGAF